MDGVLKRLQNRHPKRKRPAGLRYFLVVPAAMLLLVHARAGDLALGEYLSSECVTCHQLSGQAVGGIPPIVGLPEDRFIEKLQAYKTGKRDNDVMRTIASGLNDEDMSALAAYFGAQGPKHQ